MTRRIQLHGIEWLGRAPSAAAGDRNRCGARIGLFVLASWIGAAAPMSVRAQEVVEVADDIACPSCLVETGPPVTLVAPDDSIWFSSLSGLRVSRDSEGNYIAAPVNGNGLIAVFSTDGTYRSAYGRIGEGPGEFATDIPLLVEVGDGDVLYAIDPVHIHTLAPRAEGSLDQARMPVRVIGDAVVLQSGIAVEATVRTGAGIATVQLLQPDGTIVQSIGATETDNETGGDFTLRRTLGTSNDRMEVWSARIDRFHITRYGPDGEAKARIERTTSLFQPSASFKPGAPFQAPSHTAITGIVQDGDGLLWIAFTRPPHSFSPLANPGGAFDDLVGGERPLSDLELNMDMNRFLHTTVEVLDLSAGTVIARRDFDEQVRFVRTRDDDVLVQSLRVDEYGRYECIVTPLALRRPD